MTLPSLLQPKLKRSGVLALSQLPNVLYFLQFSGVCFFLSLPSAIAIASIFFSPFFDLRSFLLCFVSKAPYTVHMYFMTSRRLSVFFFAQPCPPSLVCGFELPHSASEYLSFSNYIISFKLNNRLYVSSTSCI